VHVRTARLLAVTLVTLGVTAYSAWLLEFLLPTGLSPVQVPVRELTAVGRPYRQVFLIAQVIAGAALLLAGPPLVRLAPVHWPARLTASAVALFGIVLLADAAYPMNTSLSLLTDMSFLLGSASLVLWWPPGWRALAVVGLILVLLTWLGTVVLTALGPEHYVGLVSRAQLLVRAFLLGAGTAYLLRGSSPVRKSRTLHAAGRSSHLNG
jgi:hypothetical protein